MSTPIRVMHVADTHFGVETYGRLDPASGLNTRLIDFTRSLSADIDLALDEGAQLVLFAGDAYKTRDPSQTHQRAFAECIRRATERGIPVAMLTGNHDLPSVRGRAHAVEIYRTLGVNGVHVLSEPGVSVIETPAGPVQIAALPYLPRGLLLKREEVAARDVEEVAALAAARYREYVDTLAAEVDPALPTVLMGHFWVRGASLSAWQQGYLNVNEPQVEQSALARPPFDYVALGHIHRHQDLNRGSQPPVVYCGSPDRIDFGERADAKGFVLVDLEKRRTRYRFVETPVARPFVEIDLAVGTETPTEEILAAIQEHRLKDAVVRLTYRVAAEALPLVREREIRQALGAAFLVVALRREVVRERAERGAMVTESLDPRVALERFLDTTSRTPERKAQLMGYAERLFEELRRDEAVS